MLIALEFINVEQHKKNSALLSFHLSSATPDLTLNRIGIICTCVCISTSIDEGKR